MRQQAAAAVQCVLRSVRPSSLRAGGRRDGDPSSMDSQEFIASLIDFIVSSPRSRTDAP